MSLRLKFNLILILTGICGLTIAGFVAFELFNRHAREEVIEKAAVMMESALAVRNYTINEIRPLLEKKTEDGFLSQTVPAYAAAQYVKNLQTKHPDYSYKEAALNPTNPSNRATDWEVDIIEWFRGHENEVELIGDRDTATGLSLYLSRPIKISNAACLACHDTPANAPPELIERYGSSNGFGWKHNEIIGAQIVSVPQSLPLKRAENEFYIFMLTLIAVFVLIGVIMNLLLHYFVISPVARIAKHADEVSMGTLDLPELDTCGKDEISSLARSFNRMQRSLASALGMLND
ncbi:MAG: DUF3365 domain-containing protein [Chromatiales bacterium]|jgi:protein-histidine pros-kinase